MRTQWMRRSEIAALEPAAQTRCASENQASAALPFFFSTLLTVAAQAQFVMITHPLGASVRLNPNT